MRLEDVNQLLEPGYLPTESGYRFFDDGYATVSSIARMPGCSAEMVEWWFGWLGGTKDYKLWHPRDHVFCDWENREPGKYIGASHLVHEYMGGSGPLYKLRITFLDPTTIFDPEAYSALDGVAICARSGLLEEPLDTGYLIHCVRNTDFGCEMRSRFFMGHLANREPGKAFSEGEAVAIRRVSDNGAASDGATQACDRGNGVSRGVSADSLSPGDRQFD
jgi:hypothetical protein